MDLSLFLRNCIILIPIYIVLTFITIKAKKPVKNWLHTGASFLFIILMMAVTIVTGLTPLSGFHTSIRFDEISWNPFYGIMQMLGLRDFYGYINVFGNVLLFVPLGFFLPLLYKSNRHLWKVTLIGFLYSFMIEFWQLFLSRGTDTADLLMNTLGAILGYLCYLLFHAIAPKFADRFIAHNDKNKSYYRCHIYIALFLPVIITVVAGFVDRYVYFHR